MTNKEKTESVEEKQSAAAGKSRNIAVNQTSETVYKHDIFWAITG